MVIEPDGQVRSAAGPTGGPQEARPPDATVMSAAAEPAATTTMKTDSPRHAQDITRPKVRAPIPSGRFEPHPIFASAVAISNPPIRSTMQTYHSTITRYRQTKYHGRPIG